MDQHHTPLEDYIAALDRAAEYCSSLAAALRGVRTEEALLQRDLLEKWVELTDKLDEERETLVQGQEQYQRWALRRFKEKQERATFKLPNFQR